MRKRNLCANGFFFIRLGVYAQAMTITDKIRAIMRANGWTQQQFAEAMGVAQSTVNRWLTGSEPEGHRRDRIVETYEQIVQGGPQARTGWIIPVMGYLGAGAAVEPDFEQVPPEGLDQVELPFPLPAEMIGFRVRGSSMLPVYKDGTIIVVFRDQKKPLEAFYGEEAAVRTADGRRFIKTIMRGQGDVVNLFSWNAPPIESVRLEWIGEIFAVLPPAVFRKA
jgi:transcriptional regulator with XRE-family HTH domain